MIKELDSVVLAVDVPAHRLKAGDVGTIVHAHAGGKGFEVEFVALDGETIAVVTRVRMLMILPSSLVSPLLRRDTDSQTLRLQHPPTYEGPHPAHVKLFTFQASMGRVR